MNTLDPLETLTAVPVSLRRLLEVSKILQRELPPALERLEADTVSLNEAVRALSRTLPSLNSWPEQAQAHLRAQAARSAAERKALLQETAAALQAHRQWGIGLLVAQAILLACTALLIWLRR